MQTSRLKQDLSEILRRASELPAGARIDVPAGASPSQVRVMELANEALAYLCGAGPVLLGAMDDRDALDFLADPANEAVDVMLPDAVLDLCVKEAAAGKDLSLRSMISMCRELLARDPHAGA